MGNSEPVGMGAGSGDPRTANGGNSGTAQRLGPDCDDMIDTPEEIKNRWPRIGALLSDCSVLYDSFAFWDRKAMQLKKIHKWIVLFSAVFGTAAVILAIGQLALLSAGELVRFRFATVEFVIAVITFTCVLAGIVAGLNQQWILQRFRAEQCRFIKYAFLRRAPYWLEQPQTLRRESLGNCVNQLRELKPNALKSFVRNELDLCFKGDLEKEIGDCSPELLAELRDLWLAKRIDPQWRFFHRRADTLGMMAARTRQALPLIFFTSLICVGVHFAIDAGLQSYKRWSSTPESEQERSTIASPKNEAEKKSALVQESHKGLGQAQESSDNSSTETEKNEPIFQVWLERVALLALFFAASLPVLAIGVRSFRSAFEFDRNENRFHGLARTLDRMKQYMTQCDRPDKFDRISWDTEDTLHDEHLSWVRLMIEAEWY